jgi:hypothetical protein
MAMDPTQVMAIMVMVIVMAITTQVGIRRKLSGIMDGLIKIISLNLSVSYKGGNYKVPPFVKRRLGGMFHLLL